jgi:hypothetical protein
VGPSTQEKLIEVDVLDSTISSRSVGASAYVIMMAPFPGVDVAESPKEFDATIVE